MADDATSKMPDAASEGDNRANDVVRRDEESRREAAKIIATSLVPRRQIVKPEDVSFMTQFRSDKPSGSRHKRRNDLPNRRRFF
jgi:hypothetical protein